MTIADLEREIDRHGLSVMLEQISEVCHLKAEHIGNNWQDIPLAKRWTALAIKLEENSTVAKGL